MKTKLSTKLILFAILFLAGAFRLYGINWDQGFHLHPDERAIIMATEKLSLPQTLSQFFSINSSWNPHFFAYGSLPFYLLYSVGQLLSPFDPNFATYGLINIPGRFISALSDLVTLIVLFFLARKLFGVQTGIVAAFFYAISVLSIQLSHFYAVDTLLTLFILLTLYQLILFYEKPSVKRGLLIGLFFGMALATKVSALVLLVSVGASLAADFLLLFLKQPHRPHHWLPQFPSFLKHFLGYSLLILAVTVVTFVFFEPYAVIDFSSFWLQTMQQSAMTRDAFTFPYTLQYVEKIPYLYELKNIFSFGLGPLVATIAFVGIGYMIVLATQKDTKDKWAQEVILLTFFFAYFFTVGKFAIGFMRYMLPVYPLLCLFAAIVTFQFVKLLHRSTQNETLRFGYYIFFVVIFLIWPLSFMHIYSKENPRVDATTWIHQHIPAGATLAVEHWDDRLPLFNSELYTIEELELYNPDSDVKWNLINAQLQRTDYLIVASNRLSTPLQKLTNCSKLPAFRCYQRTALYYQQLLTEKSGFKKVAEFTNYPTIPLITMPINDQSADESFTVYDHPKVMIFKKIKSEE